MVDDTSKKKKKPPSAPIPDHILVPPDSASDNILVNGHVAASVTYTSLRDLIPAPAMTSPTHNASWHEVPIRNPLVKQAALSYLQPMSAPPETGHEGIFGNMKKLLLCDTCGCFAWVSEKLRWVFGGGGDSVRGCVDDDDDDFDDDDEEEIDRTLTE